eukprot:g2999.t1
MEGSRRYGGQQEYASYGGQTARVVRAVEGPAGDPGVDTHALAGVPVAHPITDSKAGVVQGSAVFSKPYSAPTSQAPPSNQSQGTLCVKCGTPYPLPDGAQTFRCRKCHHLNDTGRMGPQTGDAPEAFSNKQILQTATVVATMTSSVT